MLEENNIPLGESHEEQIVALEEHIVEQEIEVCAETFVGGTRNYERLENKPSINDVELVGNKTSEELGLASIEDLDEATNDLADQIEEETSSREAEIERIDGEITELGEELNAEVNARTQADTALENSINGKATISALTAETTNRENADIELQNQIDAITSKSDVVDIVGTYAQLIAHETASLGDNDIIKVLNDETHDNAPSYYRWNKTASTWSYVGSESVAYTKGEADERFVPKTRTINGKALSANVTLTTNDLTNDSGYLVEDDLANYVKRTDYSTDTTAGVVRDANCFLTSSTNGGAYAEEMSFNSYNSASDYNFIGKGTLENVLNNRKYLMPEYTLELPTTGKDNKLYLTPAEEQDEIEAEASGKNIELTDAIEANIFDWQIKGNTEQTQYSGKNLFNFDSWKEASVERAGVTWSVSDNETIATSGTSTSGYAACFYQFTESGTNVPTGMSDGVYYAKLLSDNPNLQLYGLCRRSGSSETDILFPRTNANTKVSFSIDHTITSVRFRIVAKDTRLNCTGTSRIILSSDESFVDAGVFEPYTGGAPSPSPEYPQEVKTVTGRNTVTVVGKNLFDKDNVVPGIPDSNTGEIIRQTEVGRTTQFIRVNAGDVYTCSGQGNYGWTTTAYYDKNKSFISRPNTGNGTFTVPDNAYYMRKTCSVNALDTVQVERGSVATTYQPYSGQEVEINLGDIKLCKLGDYQDRIFKDGNEWKLEKNIMKRVFNGDDSDIHSNGWFNSSETTSTLQVCAMDVRSLHIKYDDRSDSKMTHFVYRDGTFSNGQYKLVNNASGEVNHIRISISKDIAPDLNAGKEWIAENRPEIYAILLNPVVDTITDQNLIDQLNALEEMTTVKGYNFITTDASMVQPFLSLGYYRPDPTVTKDEWLWVENHYEKLGGERKFTHNLVVNHRTAQGHWDYAFTVTGNDSHHYTQLAQVAYYLFKEHAGLSIPVSGTYTEGSNIYFLTKITASSLGQVTIEMRKLSDGSVRTISTGAVPVIDTIS